MLTRNKILSHAILVLLLVSAFPLIIQFAGDVSATGFNCTWKPTSGILASTAANWENGSAPATGDNIYFISSWVTSCSYDISTSVGAFNIRTGYSGTITQAASFSVTSYSQAAGTFTGSISYILTDTGNFTNSGLLTVGTLRLTMNGVEAVITFTNNPTLRDLVVSDSCSVSGAFMVSRNLYIATGKTLSLNSGEMEWRGSYLSGTFTNLGLIAGSSGTLALRTKTISWTWTPGIITRPVTIRLGDNADGSYSVTLQTSTILYDTLTVSSDHTTNTMTLNLNGYSLSAAGITIGTRGIISAGASVITCSGNWDSSAGAFTAGTSTLVMSGTTKTIKTANTNGALYNLQESGTTTTSSSINITHSLTVDSGKTLTIGAAKTVDFNCSNGGTYSNLGTIAGATSTLMEYSFSTGDKTLPFGIVNAPVRVRATSAANANRTLTLTSDRILGSTLLVNSDHATYTMTIDARAVYFGAVGAITEGTRGDILYATFTFISSPGFGGGVQTGHSYTYETNLSTTASPGQVYTFASNATWLQWDSTELAVYGTPDSVFGGHWYYVNISVADGMLSTYQNYTVLVVPIETLQDYIPLLMGLLFGFGLLVVGLRFRELWILAGPIWIICGMTIFITYGVAFLLISVGLGIVLLFKGVSPYL